MKGWLYFAFVQVVALIAMIVGWFLLIIPCTLGAWRPIQQIYTPEWMDSYYKKGIYVWSWDWLNSIWGNDEDGVVGITDYNPPGGRFKAYLWSAWRNSANNLRFIFRNFDGPFYRKEIGNWYFQCGWYPNGFPVLSAGRI